MSISYQPIFTDNFKFNSYTLNFLMPLNEENATCCALLSQVLKRGCEKYGEMDRIAARLEELYGATISISTNKLGENLAFTLQTYFMDNRFALEGEEIAEGVLDLASEMLLHPLTENGAFRQDFFAQEKQNHLDNILGLINDKRLYSLKRCKELMFSDTAYRFSGLGTAEYLKDLSAKALYVFYQSMLKTAAITVNYIGRKIDLEELTTRFFVLEERSAVSTIRSPFVLPAEPRFYTDEMDVAQGKLCMGLRISEPTDYYATRLFNVIYGGSPTSKLFNNVREKLSLCYYCSSTVDHFVHSIFISSGIEFENYAVARDEILRQLTDMKNGEITDEEFENGKLYLLDAVLGMRDSHAAMLGETLQHHLLEIDDTPKTQLDKIRAVTKENVIEIANKVILDTVYFLKGKEDHNR